MPGLKAIADPLAGNAQSRAVSLHAAGVGIAGACSFLVAGFFDAVAGPRRPSWPVGLCAVLAFALALRGHAGDARRRSRTGRSASLLDFRPVLANRRAMAWIAGYSVHTLEMAALRAWAVTFLAAAAARHGVPGWVPDPDRAVHRGRAARHRSSPSPATSPRRNSGGGAW